MGSLANSIEGGEREGKENELQDSALLKARESDGTFTLDGTKIVQ